MCVCVYIYIYLGAGYSHSTGGVTVAREGASAVTYDDTVLLFGGFNGRYLNDVLVLRLVQDSNWAQVKAIRLSVY